MNGKPNVKMSAAPESPRTMSDKELLEGIVKGWNGLSERDRWLTYYITAYTVPEMRSILPKQPVQ